MKFVTATILTAVLSYAAGLFMPWWSVAIAAFIVALFIVQSPLQSYLAASLGIFLLWFIISFLISSNNGHALAHRISMMVLKIDNPFLLMFVTAVIGGLVGGLAAASAAWFRRAFAGNA